MLGIVFLTKEPYKLDDTLIELTGILTEAREEGGSRYGDLLIQINTSDIQYRSPMAYPSEFKYGSRSAKVLSPGNRIVLQIEESEHKAPPRKHRIKGYKWKEFVGLSSGGTVYLAPSDHERYEQQNNKLGNYTLPLMSLFGIYLIFHGIRQLFSQKKSAHPTADKS